MAVYDVKPKNRINAKQTSAALKKAGFKKTDNSDIESNMLEIKQMAPDLGGDNPLDDRFRDSIALAAQLMHQMKLEN